MIVASYKGANIFFLAITGEQLKRDLKEVIYACYKQIGELQKVPGNTELISELLLLANQAHERNNIISGCGLFPVDHSLIHFIVSTACTYLTVLGGIVDNFKPHKYELDVHNHTNDSVVLSNVTV
ncbi:uncharacterized protein LOC126743284 [Anthonomus grandis grandis]|uniref:uncharacterized protein LOC126743284 n=1 Tax=Anthonomus grandis grandis TaxID=2921223 RepID=UPI002165E2AE|nr:uncharacterized protein LOC126743284 [Anthonomus grandis grandis]